MLEQLSLKRTNNIPFNTRFFRELSPSLKEGLSLKLRGLKKACSSFLDSYGLRDSDKLQTMGKAFFSSIERLPISKTTFFLTVASQLYSSSRARTIPVKLKRLKHFKSKELPRYETPRSSGFDVRAQLEKAIFIAPGERNIIPTGLEFELPPYFEFQARPRSGWALKEGITLLNSPGTIDSDYRGEVKIIIINHGKEKVKIAPQDRIAQLVLSPVYQGKLILTESTSKTKRGSGGFGSTGKGRQIRKKRTQKK